MQCDYCGNQKVKPAGYGGFQTATANCSEIEAELFFCEDCGAHWWEGIYSAGKDRGGG